jgi:hypothetical protein
MPWLFVSALGQRPVMGVASRRHLLRMAAAGGLTGLLPGCVLPVRSPAVPSSLTTQGTVLGVPNERFFPLAGTDPLRDEVIGSI